MPKKISYICENCGESFIEWSGRCPVCKSWNTLKEFKVPFFTKEGKQSLQEVAFISLKETEGRPLLRLFSFSPVDEILGGGIVPGSTILLGGDPGIGKSTLALKIASLVEETVYVAGEESISQIALRVKNFAVSSKIRFTETTDVSALIYTLSQKPPKFLVVDSIQTLYHPEFPSTPGSLVQVRESAMALQRFAKKTNTAVLMIGHVTKVGEIAGPRILEHLVDVVLYLEGEKSSSARLLRASKNRFGPSDEVVVFEMTEKGLIPAANPSLIFLSGHKPSIGRALTCILEGRRPFLVEVEALVAPTSFLPRRTVTGYDLNRLFTLIAVLEERSGLKLKNKDVFLNVVGGFLIKDRAADAGVCLSIASAYFQKAPPAKLCVFGEVDLLSEIRKPPLYSKRVNEIKKLGFEPLLAANLSELFKLSFQRKK